MKKNTLQRSKDIDIDGMIKKAVSEAIKVGITMGYNMKKQEADDCYKQIEKKLYSYPMLKDKIIEWQEEIDELNKVGLHERSKSIVFIPSGSRLGPDDIKEAKIQDLQYRIHNNLNEIKALDKALDKIRADYWYRIIEMKYFEGQIDDDIAAAFECDTSTIRRNRKRLVTIISVRYYGASALG